VAPLIPASTLGALLIPALPFAAPSSEVSLARIWGLGARLVGKFTVVVSVQPQRSADDGVWRVLCHGSGIALVAVFALAASRSVQAQMTVDVAKINCDQFVHHKISEPRLIAAWRSGYYNAKRNNRVIDLQALEENMSKVTNYCSDEKNFKVPLMKAVEQVLGKSN